MRLEMTWKRMSLPSWSWLVLAGLSHPDLLILCLCLRLVVSGFSWRLCPRPISKSFPEGWERIDLGTQASSAVARLQTWGVLSSSAPSRVSSLILKDLPDKDSQWILKQIPHKKQSDVTRGSLIQWCTFSVHSFGEENLYINSSSSSSPPPFYFHGTHTKDPGTLTAILRSLFDPHYSRFFSLLLLVPTFIVYW